MDDVSSLIFLYVAEQGKGSWRPDEDEMLRRKVAEFGQNWPRIIQFLPGRTTKQVRLCLSFFLSFQVQAVYIYSHELIMYIFSPPLLFLGSREMDE